ncbi:MAG: SMC-Scp complex subunit ScpB [Acidimicrobiales bacterium]
MSDQPADPTPASAGGPTEPDERTLHARRAIEAVLMVAEMPVEAQLLAQLLEVPAARVTQLCAELADEYEDAGRGFSLVAIAGGWRFQSHPDMAPYVERFVLEGQSARLSGAALETLAIVAYKQPVSRAQVAAIRGVNVDGVMRTLQQRGFIDEVGKDPGPGQAVLFGTTQLFLERIGVNALTELPPLSEFVPGADVVEHLEAGLRPPAQPSLGERLDEIESANAVRGPAGTAAEADDDDEL